MLLAFSVGGVFHRVTLKTLANTGALTLFHGLRLFLSEGLGLRLRHGGSHAHLDLQHLIENFHGIQLRPVRRNKGEFEVAIFSDPVFHDFCFMNAGIVVNDNDGVTAAF